jgi:Flp pilus assembly protein TadD
MTCPHCGIDTPGDAARCASCGAPLTPAAEPLFDTLGGAAPIGGSGTLQVDVDITRVPDAPPSRVTGPSRGAGTNTATPFLVLTPGAALGPRYQIIRLLGVGGMGAVYQAWDAELGVAVALKVIRPDASAGPDATAAAERQFKRELLLARQVTHKHVVRIHDLGDIDGVKYISMPYVKGADLATMLKRSGRLEIPRACRYVRQIVEGLIAAHEAGVVHRDLKPANIMIDEDDEALIMDFGIAHSPTGTASGSGRVVGTLLYMSPEQAQAQPTDQRADIYALGMMFREMLVGRTAGDGQAAVADLMQRMREAPASVRSIDPLIPEPLDALIARCVEPDPANRFQTSVELAAALAALDEHGHLRPVVAPAPPSPWRLVAAAAAVIAAIGVATVVIRRGPPAPPKPIEPVSILVADFDNKTGDAVFNGALEQALTLEMESAAFISALPRTDAQQVAKTLKGGDTRLDAATAQLVAFRQGIKYVLAGDVSAKNGGYTLQLRAVNPANASVLKAVSADARTKADVLPAIGTVASRLRAALGDTAAGGAKSSPNETFTASSLDALREYTAAQEAALSRKDDEAVMHYRRAIDLDPKFGRAYSGLAISAQRLGNSDEADTAWKTALSLIDRMTDREKYRTLGSYYLGIARNFEKAVDNYSALVAAYPADDAGFGNLALAHFYLHDFAKSMSEARRAAELNPKNLIARNNLALFAMYAGDFTTAAAEARQVIAEHGARANTYLPLVMEAIAKGDHAAAAAAYDEMAKNGARAASIANLGHGDLALYEGRGAAAADVLKAGLAADLAAKNTPAAALKQVALAEEHLAAGRRPQAASVAQDALKLSRQIGVLVPAARVLILAGKAGEARPIAQELEGQLQKESRAYGKILLAEIALEEKKTAEAIDLLTQARALIDLWLGRFDLGVAYIQRDAFAEALPELEACQKRRGEATALFFDDFPTVRYLATVPYWTGRAEEGLQMASAKSRYEAFLALRKDATNDPLAQDARKRLAR